MAAAVAAATSTVKFATPVGGAASGVELGTNGLSTCFLGTAQAGAKSDVAVAVDAGGFVRSADTLVVSGNELRTKDCAGIPVTNPAGAGNVFCFAVDLRSGYPAASAIAPASVNPSACAGLGATAPCYGHPYDGSGPLARMNLRLRQPLQVERHQNRAPGPGRRCQQLQARRRRPPLAALMPQGRTRQCVRP